MKSIAFVAVHDRRERDAFSMSPLVGMNFEIVTCSRDSPSPLPESLIIDRPSTPRTVWLELLREISGENFRERFAVGPWHSTNPK